MRLIDRPLLLAIAALTLMWLAAVVGARLRSRRDPLGENLECELAVILTASLTMLALLVGFAFSMAASRYDLRKSYEEAEANAIGTEYLRVGLLTPSETQRARSLLRHYLDQRIHFYTARGSLELDRINNDTTRLPSELWEAVQTPVELRQDHTSADWSLQA